jgi:hypothetical protein
MSFDQEDYDRALANVQDGHGREEFAPTTEQKLGRFTLVSLPLNRTIGSGIFVTPALILKGTGSVGASLLLWAAGAIISTTGLLVWLELGLSVPRQRVRDGSKRSVPRSGGEKNYVRTPPFRLPRASGCSHVEARIHFSTHAYDMHVRSRVHHSG